MELLRSEAILLDVMPLADYDRIAAFLTPRYGLKRGVAQGARRKHSRFAGTLQPLAKVRLTWREKEGRELVRLGEVELVRPAARLQRELEGILLGGYLAEHMLEFTQENEDCRHLYRLLDTTLEALLAGADHELASRYYEAWVLRLGGIFPSPEECPACGGPLGEGPGTLPAEADGILCDRCARERPGGTRIPPDVLALLRRFGRENLERLTAAPPSREHLEVVETLCRQVRRTFLGRELKSYRVMRRALAVGSAG